MSNESGRGREMQFVTLGIDREVFGVPVAPENTAVDNPAFDVTPAEYVDLIVTERGAIPPELAYMVIRDYLGWKIEEFR